MEVVEGCVRDLLVLWRVDVLLFRVIDRLLLRVLILFLLTP